MTPKKCKSSKRFLTSDVNITIIGGKFIPDCPHVPRGVVTIHVVNKDALTTHSFTVPGTKLDVSLRGGEEGTAKLKVDGTGQIRFFCRLHPSLMFGALFPTS